MSDTPTYDAVQEILTDMFLVFGVDPTEIEVSEEVFDILTQEMSFKEYRGTKLAPVKLSHVLSKETGGIVKLKSI